MLPVLAALAETGQTTAAADFLQMPQSTVSRTLTRLGKELGVPVVERHGRTLRLTPAGEALVPHAAAVIASASAGVEAVRSHGTPAATVTATVRCWQGDVPRWRRIVIRRITRSKARLSWRCPALVTLASSRHRLSGGQVNLAVSPPRDRPNASRSPAGPPRPPGPPVRSDRPVRRPQRGHSCDSTQPPCAARGAHPPAPPAAGRYPPAAGAGHRRRAGAHRPTPSSRSPTNPRRAPRPRRSLPATRPGSPPTSRHPTSGDAGCTPSSTACTAPAGPATGHRAAARRRTLNRRVAITLGLGLDGLVTVYLFAFRAGDPIGPLTTGGGSIPLGAPVVTRRNSVSPAQTPEGQVASAVRPRPVRTGPRRPLRPSEPNSCNIRRSRVP